ncbi:hypothetical protein WBP06_03710 [Novosphingobium sp. BL-8H]|uniref:hypothetical protein n=1 Tax=Novosphingobium sp. BL-8H TaxID=3127640 RepID=UPI00375847A2
MISDRVPAVFAKHISRIRLLTAGAEGVHEKLGRNGELSEITLVENSRHNPAAAIHGTDPEGDIQQSAILARLVTDPH